MNKNEYIKTLLSIMQQVIAFKCKQVEVLQINIKFTYKS